MINFQFHFDHPENDRDIPIRDVQRFIEAIQARYAERDRQAADKAAKTLETRS